MKQPRTEDRMFAFLTRRISALEQMTVFYLNEDSPPKWVFTACNETEDWGNVLDIYKLLRRKKHETS